MKNTTLFLFVFMTMGIHCFGQFSKTHYIPPLSKESTSGEYYFYISTPVSSDVKIKVIEIGGSSISGTVNNNNPYILNITPTAGSQLFVDKSLMGVVKNKGYIIEAEDLVYVSLRVVADINNSGGYLQGGGIVSKGNSALGKEFRLGAMLNPTYHPKFLNFASVLSTENGTQVSISNIAKGTVLSDGTVVNGPIDITLNKNESYVLAMENFDDGTIGNSNSSHIIGALVESDKPVVVNTGSYCGTNSELVNSNGRAVGRDIGFDQIVPYERTGKAYIFVKSLGTDELERVLLIANKDNTAVYINGNSSPVSTLDRGEHILLDGSSFMNGNLYVSASEDMFAYQSIAGTTSAPNQNFFFVPPLNCATPNIVDNIPKVESIGSIQFDGKLNIVTETGASVTINGSPISASPVQVVGNPDYVRYSVNNLYGNMAIQSTGQVYVSYFGNNGAATYGGYYSGFDVKPEIVSNNNSGSGTTCLPNVSLEISSFSSYDSFEWFFNDQAIPGAHANTYVPTQPGYYQVKGRISGCDISNLSDRIPVSLCPLDTDMDGTNNNLDLDLDNDGILNSEEANITKLDQSDPFSGANYTGSSTGKGQITGKSSYGFVSEVPKGTGSPLTYTLNFTHSETISLSYIPEDNPGQSTNISEYLDSKGDFTVRVPFDKTISVYDPENQLLIDTNYDGIYESGVTEFSSFEIRFRLKSTTALKPGSGSFIFSSYLTNSIRLVHNNLSETQSNKTIFMLRRTETYDTDSDGIPDLLDIDSDNDGIPDTIEAQGSNEKVFSGIDSDGNGLDDAFEPGLNPIDTDADNVPDYLDLDADNDGIYDLVESGSGISDTDQNGRIDGVASSFGMNGLYDQLETSPDNGILNYNIADSDTNGKFDYTELDSDDDGCYDVIETGFEDADGNGSLGSAPDKVDQNGLITGYTSGYTVPLDYDSNGIYDFQEYNILKAGINSEVSLCASNEPVDLFDYLGDEADLGGVWTPSLKSGSGIFDPKTDVSGTYTYTVNNRICGEDSAALVIKVYDAPDAGENVAISLCKADNPIALYNILGGNPHANGTWTPDLGNSRGSFDPKTNSSGVYTYTVTNGICESVSATVAVKVSPSPNAGENNSLNICVNSGPVDLLENLKGDPQAGGTWVPALSEGNSFLDPKVDPEGTYTYMLDYGECGKASAQVEVIYKYPFPIDRYEIKTTDLSENNKIEILINQEGVFKYSLDGFNYQTGNIFEHLKGGAHKLYIQEVNGCAFLELKVYLLDYKKFFTPNNDGYNDYWKIMADGQEYSVKIFDRYGKLLRVLKKNERWDGTYNGKDLPSNDYWFTLTIKDGITKSGHFSLIR